MHFKASERYNHVKGNIVSEAALYKRGLDREMSNDSICKPFLQTPNPVDVIDEADNQHEGNFSSIVKLSSIQATRTKNTSMLNNNEK